MGTYLEQPTVDKILTPIMVVINQYKLDTIKYRREGLEDNISDTKFEVIAIRNNSNKVNTDGIIGNDPLCKITPRELTEAIHKTLMLLLTHYVGKVDEYLGGLDFKITITPRKVNVQYELEDGRVLKTAYSRNLSH